MMAAPAAPAAANLADERRGMIAKIHVAKKQLALADDSYRALLARVGGGESLSAMGLGQLEAVLAEFRRLGWRARRAGSDKAQVRMIWGLWKQLEEYVAVPSASALRSFCHRQTGVDDPEFLSPEQANKVIEGLKSWLARARRARGDVAKGAQG